MSGSGMLTYGEKDNSKIVYFLIFVLSILCIWYSYSMDLYEKLIQNGVSPSSDIVSPILIAVFRTLCAYLAFHSLIFIRYLVFLRDYIEKKSKSILITKLLVEKISASLKIND